MRVQVFRNKTDRTFFGWQYTGEFAKSLEQIRAGMERAATALVKAMLRIELQPHIDAFLQKQAGVLDLPPPMAQTKSCLSRGESRTSGQP